MKMRLLLGSGGFRTEERVALLGEQMKSFFGPIDRLLFLPYALHNHDAYVQTMIDRGLHGGYELDGIHKQVDPVHAIREAKGIYVGGGNTFRLLNCLHQLNLLEIIRERVKKGIPYLGISAGTNVACPTIKTTNDMPIVEPPTLQALGLIPFQINAHYYTGSFYLKEGDTYQEHFGETRDDRIREFHEMNKPPVLGLWEGGFVRLENDSMTLLGAGARIFRKDEKPVDMKPGDRLDSLLPICCT